MSTIPFVILALLLVGSPAPSPADPPGNDTPPGAAPPDEKASRDVDERSEKLLRALGRAVRESRSFRVGIAESIELGGPGMRQEITTSYTLAVRRPNMLAMRLQNGLSGATVVCDGEEVCTWKAATSSYTITEAPATLAELKLGGSSSFASQWVEFLLAEDFFEYMTRQATAVRYLGLEDVDDVRCHALAMKYRPPGSREGFEMAWKLWLREGSPPLPRRVSADVSDLHPSGGQVRAHVTVEFTDWKLDVDVPASEFDYTPPAGARKEPASR